MTNDLEARLREALEATLDCHELSMSYPNPFQGLPSPLTASLIQAQGWIKKALSETISADIDRKRGGKIVSTIAAQFGLEELKE